MLKHNQKYLIIDTETDGLRLTDVKPWQIAWSLAEGNRITKVYNEYLDFPDLQINDTIAKLTGFNWQQYNKRKKDPKEVWNSLRKDLFDSDRIVVGQNLLGFDIFVIASLQKHLGEDPDYSYINRIYDTRPLGKAYKENLTKPTSGDFLSWQYKVIHDRSLKAKSSQLFQLKNLGIDFDESKLHDAEYDIEMTFKIFLELKKRMNF
jgi:DNA polymerase III epsilon subunit-like protein